MSVWPKTCKAGQWWMLRDASTANSCMVCHATILQRLKVPLPHLSQERLLDHGLCRLQILCSDDASISLYLSSQSLQQSAQPSYW